MLRKIIETSVGALGKNAPPPKKIDLKFNVQCCDLSSPQMKTLESLQFIDVLFVESLAWSAYF